MFWSNWTNKKYQSKLNLNEWSDYPPKWRFERFTSKANLLYKLKNDEKPKLSLRTKVSKDKKITMSIYLWVGKSSLCTVKCRIKAGKQVTGINS